jgi:hypothetical protein
MLGLNLLVRLGRTFLAGPVLDLGVLPSSCYRHLALAALEEEDFPGALSSLKWADDPLLVQVLIFRLRLLTARHRRQAQALGDLVQTDLSEEQRATCQDLMKEEDRALNLLNGYEARALGMLG